MRSLRVPEGATGINTFCTDPWWAQHPADPGQLDRCEGSATLTWDDDRWAGLRTLLVVAPIERWLPGETLGERIGAAEAWAATVGRLAVEAENGPTVLAVLPDEPEGVAHLAEMALGSRGATPDRPVSVAPAVPGVVSHGGAAAQAYAATLAAALEPGAVHGWASMEPAAQDAVLSADHAFAASEPSEPSELRRITQAALHAIEDADVRIVGPRELLLWPAPDIATRIPFEIVTQIATDVIRGQLERPVLDPDLVEEIALLEQTVRARRASLAQLEAERPSLATLPRGDLVRRLWRSAG